MATRKNPFATGCRGISAKRSAPSPLELGEQLYRLLGPAPDRTQRAERAGPQQPAQWQDLSALELLLEAAGRLGPIEQQQQQRRRLASRLGHNFGQLDEGLAQNLWRAGSPLAPTHKDAAELVK